MKRLGIVAAAWLCIVLSLCLMVMVGASLGSADRSVLEGIGTGLRGGVAIGLASLPFFLLSRFGRRMWIPGPTGF